MQIMLSVKIHVISSQTHLRMLDLVNNIIPHLWTDCTEFSNFAREDRTADELLITAGRGMFILSTTGTSLSPFAQLLLQAFFLRQSSRCCFMQLMMCHEFMLPLPYLHEGLEKLKSATKSSLIPKISDHLSKLSE